ncbi:MAG TPA: sigma-70 family RNA polymerase sigma factor [Acholeplasma sp.]|nr:sigma-70 family RNA polymerase sigma factor [Acholeplasma sp.]
MPVYNDYELIYLIQSEQCEVALNILIRKYRLLALKYIHQFQLRETDREDYLQEAAIILYKAVNLFIENYNKTFTRYYELLLRRRFIYLKKNEPQYVLNEGASYAKEDRPFYKHQKLDGLASFEQVVYKRYFVLNQKISFIAKSESKSAKQIYNAIYRIKSKYKNNML